MVMWVKKQKSILNFVNPSSQSHTELRLMKAIMTLCICAILAVSAVSCRSKPKSMMLTSLQCQWSVETKQLFVRGEIENTSDTTLTCGELSRVQPVVRLYDSLGNVQGRLKDASLNVPFEIPGGTDVKFDARGRMVNKTDNFTSLKPGDRTVFKACLYVGDLNLKDAGLFTIEAKLEGKGASFELVSNRMRLDECVGKNGAGSQNKD